ncbi:hypothetical protein AZF37_05690 [endosymbiont 'TC1' of Trimyema compressum]|nr:hypothetical protein AZF37_05690 [endosymbiont 'TC1' of Trimyema compressum]
MSQGSILAVIHNGNLIFKKKKSILHIWEGIVVKQIDARGLECPKPVILTKKALEETNSISILVDNEVARDNVRRFGENGGFDVTILENSKGIELFLKKIKGLEKTTNNSPVVVLIKKDVFGDGERALGELLMKNFLTSLLESDDKIGSLIFMNKGVVLTTTSEDAIPILKDLEAQGTRIFSCGTCLDFYELKDQLKIGEITNMYSATELLLKKNIRTIII